MNDRGHCSSLLAELDDKELALAFRLIPKDKGGRSICQT